MRPAPSLTAPLPSPSLQSVVRAAAAHNEPLARPAGGGGGYEMAGDVPEMMLKRYLDMAGAYLWAYDRGIRQEILEKIRKLDAQQFNALNASDKNRTIMSMLPHSRYTAAMYAEVGGIGQLGQTVDQLARLQDGAFMHIDPNPLPGMAQLLLVLARMAREDSPQLSRPSTWPRLADGPRWGQPPLSGDELPALRMKTARRRLQLEHCMLSVFFRAGSIDKPTGLSLTELCVLEN